MRQRIAVYGGSFDPFHLGHLVPTVRAQETFHFEAVFFVPAGEPPHKVGAPLTDVTDRFAMVAIATLPFDRFYVSNAEVFSERPTFTADTVRCFGDRFPDSEIYFILGSDSFSQIGEWGRWRELVDLAHLVVLHRAHMWGDELASKVPSELRSRMRTVAPFEKVPDPTEKTVFLLNHEPFPISGTSIRERQRQGRPIRELVPHEVNSYIEKYRLYRQRQGHPTMLDDDTLNLVRLATTAAQDKKAFDVTVLDVSEVTSFTDAFVLCSTSSDRHLQAVTDSLLRSLRDNRRRPLHTEGGSGAQWTLIDYGDVIVHVFTEERRAFYNLEGLWGDAARLTPSDLGLDEPGPSPA